ncbi:unnamed protein product [Rotaria sordida]|uniref:RHD domain-containing protein n=1 Tax=Rotaria sordida TaxID=392033 RepID=A0A814EVR3_9BILA|nr:unnamed protein product [Rotaria sordida]
MAQLNLPLHIIAQPKVSHRERYLCEIDRTRNQAQRFIRAETNPYHLDYPTVEIPNHWDSQSLYIRVTLVTVPSEQVPVTCIHPYPIDTSEINVIKDAVRNTLYFPISEEELTNGRKSFRITRRKLTLPDLRNYGQLRLLKEDEKDFPRTDNPHDVRRIIDIYQLGKSQLLFSMAQLVQDDLLPIIYDVTSVLSHIMTAIIATHIKNPESFVRCVPKKGRWSGGDNILMVIPKLDKRKTCQVYFEGSSSNEKSQINIEFVDMKTIAFTTPPCPIQAFGNQNIEIPIVVSQSGEEIARVNFLYQSCDRCSNCDIDAMLESFDSSDSDELSSTLDMSLDEADFSHLVVKKGDNKNKLVSYA